MGLNQIPTSTRWIRDAVGEVGRQAVDSVFLIICPQEAEDGHIPRQQSHTKGTGFLLNNGIILTNAHVVEPARPDDIKVISAYGKNIEIERIIKDRTRDIAILIPANERNGGLALSEDNDLSPGLQVSTWGHPLGYSGPAPILSVGFLAGYQEVVVDGNSVKQLIVNGAFNNGNSGGPLFVSDEDEVIGIVVAKHAPFTQFQEVALESMENYSSGMQYGFNTADGEKFQLSEAQIVADFLKQFQQLTQVMIGHAVHVSEVKQSLSEQDL